MVWGSDVSMYDSGFQVKDVGASEKRRTNIDASIPAYNSYTRAPRKWSSIVGSSNFGVQIFVHAFRMAYRL